MAFNKREMWTFEELIAETGFVCIVIIQYLLYLFE